MEALEEWLAPEPLPDDDEDEEWRLFFFLFLSLRMRFRCVRAAANLLTRASFASRNAIVMDSTISFERILGSDIPKMPDALPGRSSSTAAE